MSNNTSNKVHKVNQFKTTMTLAGKEFAAYFQTPIAYVVIWIYLIISGYLFFDRFFIENQLTMRVFFEMQPLILAILVPAITMRIFSEEWKSGSLELLFTLPISHTSLVIGKFLAAFLFMGVNLLFTIFYPITLSFLGNLDWGMVIGGYIGLLLAGGVYIAVGIIVSAVTSDQIISLIIGLLACVLLYFIGQRDLIQFLPPFIARIIEYISVSFHTRNLARGLIDLRDVVYFISMIVIGLYITRLLISNRR